MVDWSAFYTFAKDWQTLIAGVLAFSGAWATLTGVQKQIRSAEIIERRRLDREIYAARAGLPATLSAIGRYAINTIAVLKQARQLQDILSRKSLLVEMPKPPEALVMEISNVIRLVDGSHSQALADVISHFQVSESRLLALYVGRHAGDVAKPTNEALDQAIADSAELYGMIAGLFSWARREAEQPSDHDRVAGYWSALSLTTVDADRFPHVHELVALAERQASRP